MKKLVATIIIFLFIGTPVILAANTDSAKMVRTSSQYLSDGSTNFPQDNSARSFEMWIKPDTITQYDMVQLSYGTESAKSNWQWWCSWGGSPGYQVISTYAQDASATSDSVVPIDAWHHIAVTYDGTTVTYYLDGVADGTATFLAALTTGVTAGIKLGVNTNVGAIFDGQIDEVRVWDDERTAQEIADNYDCEIASDEAGLVSYWKFDDGTGNLLDETTSNNDLTNNNGVTFPADPAPTTGACGGAAPAGWEFYDVD